MAKTYDVLAGGIARKPKKQYDVLDGGLTKRVKKEYVVDRNPALRNLPEGYTQREYIESTGAQYINTRLKQNNNTRVVMDAQVTSQPSATSWLFEGRTTYTTGGGCKGLFLLNGATWTSDYENSQNRITVTGVGVTDKLHVDYNGNTLTVNDFSHTWTPITFQSAKELYLLACNDNGTASFFTPTKLEVCQIYGDGVTIDRDYIPCTDHSGVAGLYDMVNGTFTGSETGTPFVAGPELPEKCTRLVYIGQQQGSISVSPASLSIIGAAGTTKTATITKTGTGAVTAISSNSGVATATVSGNTVTVKLVASGSATITLNLAATDDYSAASSTIAVTTKAKPAAATSATSGVSYTSGLSGLSASDVSLFAEAISNNSAITSATSTVYIDYGSVHRKLSVGDQATLAISSTNYAFDIIGFNHDPLTTATAYGASTATGKAGITLQMHDIFVTTYSMNSTNTNNGGWVSSAMRTTTMGTLKGLLPSAWQSVIKPVNKKTSAGQKSTAINNVSDSCFLLSEIEIYGSTSYSVAGEGSQYAYYKAGNSRVKKKSGTATDWWERSPYSDNSLAFCSVTSGGSATNGTSSSKKGVSFAFCI